MDKRQPVGLEQELLDLAMSPATTTELIAAAEALQARYGAGDAVVARQIADVGDAAVARRAREDGLARSVRHFVAAQRISHVGSYDFDIASNTNDWSDQLYRIYGREPQSFNATYEKFLDMVHPDDRETIIGVHQKALADLSPYEMEERVVWPDGQVRTLASWGEVVAGPDGKPARMVGICWDITEQKATSAALARSSEHLERVIESAPDVVLVVSEQGLVLQANQRIRDVLGWAPDEVIGKPAITLIPAGLGAQGPPRERVARTRDGEEFPVELSSSEIETADGTVTAAFVRDLRDRKKTEELALRLHDADQRRRHALEINDNVVQGLASVLYLLDVGSQTAAHEAARRAMGTARGMMDALLSDLGPGALSPGELIREQGHAATLEGVVVPLQRVARADALRVLIADDAADIRLLLRLALSLTDAFDVIGEATNGLEAVDQVRRHRPDVVLLDLSMPVMDGLQAIPEIRTACAATRIVVLSGFDEDRMRPVAMKLGADAYLQKGEAVEELVQTLAALFPDRSLDASLAPEDLEESAGGLTFDGDMVVHELRTPLTVITGMLTTLRDRMDVLPSATTRELVDAAVRNARQMAELLDAVSDARRAAHEPLPVVTERTDLGRLVRDAVADQSAGRGAALPTVHVAAEVRADVDPVRVRQVIANLLSNAFRFSPPGTPVTVSVTAQDGVAEITVHDGGPGVPETRRDELFTKFARLGQTGHGMGLGLYISRAIARAHGGDLELRDGPGATFVLTLPLRTSAEVGTTRD